MFKREDTNDPPGDPPPGQRKLTNITHDPPNNSKGILDNLLRQKTAQSLPPRKTNKHRQSIPTISQTDTNKSDNQRSLGSQSNNVTLGKPKWILKKGEALLVDGQGEITEKSLIEQYNNDKEYSSTSDMKDVKQKALAKGTWYPDVAWPIALACFLFVDLPIGLITGLGSLLTFITGLGTCLTMQMPISDYLVKERFAVEFSEATQQFGPKKNFTEGQENTFFTNDDNAKKEDKAYWNSNNDSENYGITPIIS